MAVLVRYRKEKVKSTVILVVLAQSASCSFSRYKPQRSRVQLLLALDMERANRMAYLLQCHGGNGWPW